MQVPPVIIGGICHEINLHGMLAWKYPMVSTWPGATTGLIDKLVSKNISIEAGHGGTLPWDFLEKEGKLTGKS